MDFNKLSYFVSICDLGSLSAAAKKLFLSRQALSQTIKSMENELGIKLFIKDTTKMVLTEEGKVLLENSKKILNMWKETEDQLRPSSNQILIRAGFGRWTFNLWPFDQNELFSVSNPNITLETVSRLPDELWQQLCGDSIDVLVSSVFPIFDNNIKTYLLCKTPFVCMMGKSHPLSTRSTITLNDFRNQLIYEYDGVSAYNQQLKNFFTKNDIPVQYKPFPSNDISSILLTMKKNQGIWPCTSFYISLNFDPNEIVYIPISFPANLNPPTKDVYAVIKKERQYDPALLTYISFLKKTIIKPHLLAFFSHLSFESTIY